MKMKKSSEGNLISIKTINIQYSTIKIQGMSPLLTHAWSEKAKIEMLDKQTGKTKIMPKKPRFPFEEFVQSAYWMTPMPTGENKEELEKNFEKVVQSSRWGFPAVAIKEAAIMAASRNGIDIKTTSLKGCFFVLGEGPRQLVEIKGCLPHIQEDMVHIGTISKTADLRYRAQFDDWYMELVIRYNANGPVSLEQIVNLINLGGFSCGIGEWRPERNGICGTFQVVP